MATAEELRSEFQSFMEKMDVKFRVTDEADNIVRVGFATSSGEVTIFIDFDEREDHASSTHFTCMQAGTPKEDCKSKAYVACNDWNRDHRWAKFFVGRDGDVWADYDAQIFPGTAGEECLAVVMLLIRNIDEFRKENEAILKSGVDLDELEAIRELLKKMLEDSREED